MEYEPKINTTKISFNNEPRLSEHEAQQKFNEKRINLIPHIKGYISASELFKNKEVTVTFSHKGVSSLVSVIEANGEKMILKIPLSIDSAPNEGEFLKVWEQAGVKVPHIINDGIMNGHPYLLMEYVDAPTLYDAYSQEELLEKGIHFEMGQTLRRMHTPEAPGYGRIVEGKAEFVEFSDWLNGDDVQTRITYAKEHELLGDEHGSISTAFDILLSHIAKNNKSSYCHDDFGAQNIFATHPITVFDPNPRFNNGYVDLGRSIAIHISQGLPFPEQLIAGYFENTSCDKKVLHASILLNAYTKFFYWHKVNKFKHMENLQRYLVENKHLLEK